MHFSRKLKKEQFINFKGSGSIKKLTSFYHTRHNVGLACGGQTEGQGQTSKRSSFCRDGHQC